MVNRLVLGTAQLGMDYGINNKRGKIPRPQALGVLRKAVNCGIDTFDTAYSYGDSERILGEFIASAHPNIKIISKLAECSAAEVKGIFDRSLSNMKISRTYGYLIHSFRAYKKDSRVWDELARLRQEGRVEKTGFSLYHPAELEDLLSRKIDIGIIQIPFNIFDRRFQQYLEELKNRGIEVYGRSVFLQGLVFMKPQALPADFKEIEGKIQALNILSKKTGVSVAGLCLGFVLANELIQKVVVGVDNLENLEEIIRVADNFAPNQEALDALCGLRVDNENILLPFNWKLSEVRQ